MNKAAARKMIAATALMNTLIAGSLTAAEPDPYFALSQQVLRLFHYSETEGRLEATDPVGTGFLIEAQDAMYLVSAGHMSKMGDLYTKVTVQGETRGLLIPRTAWVRHPLAETAAPVLPRVPGQPAPPPAIKAPDVAVARVAKPQDWVLSTATLGYLDPEPMDTVIAAGYPGSFAVAARTPRPLLRKGIVAMKNDVPAINQAGAHALADARVRVLDMLTLAGNSGSPVFVAEGFPHKKVVVGLVSSGDPEMALAFSEPVSRIHETLAHAAKVCKVEEASWRVVR